MIFSAMLVPISFGAPKQHATATWLYSDGATQKNDGTIRTIITMNVDDGWHTYWKNPGEGGLPLSIEAKLPEGWAIGEILFPVPIRFMTGDLPGFGYEGEVIFPINLTPPENFQGKLPALSAKISWLTCSDETCLPGTADLELSAGPHDKLIETAYAALPRAIPDAKLTIVSDETSFIFSMVIPEGSDIDPSSFEIFPATADVIDAAAKPRFQKSPTIPNTWTASAQKSEYLTETPEKIILVLKGKNGASYEISSE